MDIAIGAVCGQCFCRRAGRTIGRTMDSDDRNDRSPTSYFLELFRIPLDHSHIANSQIYDNRQSLVVSVGCSGDFPVYRPVETALSVFFRR